VDTCSAVSGVQMASLEQQAEATEPGAAGCTAQEWSCDGAAAADAGDNPIILGTSLFFARVPPTIPYESIMELFAQFGTVLTLNLFRPWATAKTSKVRPA
jgi:hypothetical protein